MNEVEQEAVQDSAEENSIDSVIINSTHFKKNSSILTVNLKTSAGPNKVNKGSNGNIMPLHIYKTLFPKITNEQSAAPKTKNILLKTYNKLQ